MSSLVSVVGDNSVDDWKLRIALTDHPFAQFHRKFWGVKEVADTEGEQPLSSSTAVSIPPSSSDMEIDESTAEDDDIDPSCYVLDIDIRGMEDKIWVRADYIRMFKFAEEFYTEIENASNPLSPCLVITGQPGTGKSIWRLYALRACCAQKKPVIFYSVTTCWLFVEEGVFAQPTSFDALSYKTVIWTLVDSVDTPSGLPPKLITHGSQHFVIYTTTPTPPSWNKAHQSMALAVCVMNPWTRAEIHTAAPFRAPDVPLTVIDKIFDELGPTPRLCFGSEDVLNEHRIGLDEALSSLRLRYLEDISFARGGLALDDVSHKMYMLRRSGACVDSIEVDIVTITPFVASKLAAQMRALERHELVRLFKCYIALPSTRRIAGDIFESYCHIIFSKRIKFDFVPMVRIGGQLQTRATKNPRWYSSHTKFKGSKDSATMEALRVGASADRTSLYVIPSRVVNYTPEEVADGIQIEANVYYIPVKANQVLGINSFILHNNNFYLLQMTASDTHGIEDKLSPFLLSLKGLPLRHNWCFISIKPPCLHILACPVPDCAELWDIALYSAEVEVES